MAVSRSKSGNPAFDAIRMTFPVWLHIALFSSLVNILMLTGSLYMMQLYDRVLASHSIATLVGVSLIALAAYALQGWLDHIRQKMLARIGCSVDAALSPLTLKAALFGDEARARPAESLASFRDLAALRNYLGSLGPTALIDIPFTPLFLSVSFLLHPWLGWLTVFGMATIVSLAILAERLSSGPSLTVTASNAEQTHILESGRRNAETIGALGMRAAFEKRFDAIHKRHVDDSLRATEQVSSVGSIAKTFRFILQSAVLGLGALLVIRGEMSGGAMLAASIVAARALAPVELAVGHLKAFTQARQGLERLRTNLQATAAGPSMALPPPKTSLQVDNLAVAAPGGSTAIISRISFKLQAGDVLGLIGPSGSGKSTLGRTIVGAWRQTLGEIRFDGTSMSAWDPDDLGRSIGYLPQDVALFPGTIAENIARLDPEATADSILSAAHAAGCHGMISAFADGYESLIGDGGVTLSGGQRQRIGLARALYGDPFFVLLDEPNTGLDAEGDEALSLAIQGVKARGGIVIVISHRPSGLGEANKVAVIVGGRLQAFGPKEQVLAPTDVITPPPLRIDEARPALTLKEIADTMRRPLLQSAQETTGRRSLSG